MKVIGWNESDLRHAHELGEIHKAGADDELMQEICLALGRIESVVSMPRAFVTFVSRILERKLDCIHKLFSRTVHFACLHHVRSDGGPEPSLLVRGRRPQ